jgi:Asp-tRNA(Asn)/Glu-tRNA(Gln) amidotransferase C subunit
VKPKSRAAARFTSGFVFVDLQLHRELAHRIDVSSQVRTDKPQPVIDAASVLQTRMKDARGGLIR